MTILLPLNTSSDVELSYFCTDLELLDNRIACFGETLPTFEQVSKPQFKIFLT
jgi:hypothetical protein